MKIHPVGAELFHEDRQTDRRNEAVAFRNSANAPEKAHFGSGMNSKAKNIRIKGSGIVVTA